MQSGPIYLPLTRGKAPADIGRFHSLLEVHTIMINAKTGSTELTFGLGKSGRIWPLYTHRQSNSNYTPRPMGAHLPYHLLLRMNFAARLITYYRRIRTGLHVTGFTIKFSLSASRGLSGYFNTTEGTI